MRTTKEFARSRLARTAATALATVAITGSFGGCTRWWRSNRPAPRTTQNAAASPAAPAPAPPRSALAGAAAPAASSWQVEMLASVNTERAKVGVRPVTLCGNLDEAAQTFANELARRGTLSHRGANGSNPATRARAAGYVPAQGQRYIAGAENVAQGHPTVAAVMDGWMRSSGHRTNILASASTHIGLGRQGAMWVQDFGAGGTC